MWKQFQEIPGNKRSLHTCMGIPVKSKKIETMLATFLDPRFAAASLDKFKTCHTIFTKGYSIGRYVSHDWVINIDNIFYHTASWTPLANTLFLPDLLHEKDDPVLLWMVGLLPVVLFALWSASAAAVLYAISMPWTAV